MGQVYEPNGKVLEGNYEGKNVYWLHDGSFAIVTGKIDTRLFGAGHIIHKKIDKTTVERFVELGTAQTGADASAVAKGMFWAGPLGAAIGAAASQSFSGDLAIYFKDGEKCVIRMFHPKPFQALKSKLFVL
ncbi:MAG: hypothetical protein IJA02_09815 [Clostridia bacterium]|nr:hypothetical protein [Clostridia bacterium]